MKKTGEYIREKRQSKGYSYRVLGRLAGVSHQHIRDIEEGKKEPSFTLLMKVINALMVDICKFLKETGYTDAEIEEAKGLRRIPVISWTQAGHWREVVEISGEYDEYVETDSKGVFGLRVMGDSIEPEFHEDDIIVINPYLKQEHNNYIVVCNEEGEATFKQLKKYGRTRVLHPLNSEYDDIELNKDIKYSVVCIVVEKIKKK